MSEFRRNSSNSLTSIKSGLTKTSRLRIKSLSPVTIFFVQPSMPLTAGMPSPLARVQTCPSASGSSVTMPTTFLKSTKTECESLDARASVSHDIEY